MPQYDYQGRPPLPGGGGFSFRPPPMPPIMDNGDGTASHGWPPQGGSGSMMRRPAWASYPSYLPPRPWMPQQNQMRQRWQSPSAMFPRPPYSGYPEGFNPLNNAGPYSQ